MRRFANSSEFKQGLNSVLEPWSAARRGGHNPSHYGYTGDEWVQDAHDLEKYIQYQLSKDNSRRGVQNIQRFLEQNKGYEWDEAWSTVKDVERGKGLRQLNMGIPAANADEEVARYVLEQAGFNNAKLENFDPVTGTDLSGTYKGRDFDIDAQTRTRGDSALRLGVLGSVPNIQREINSMTPNMKLNDLILQIREQYPDPSDPKKKEYRAREDKLLHTEDVDLRPSRWLDQNISNSNKDIIITSARPKYRQTTQGLLDRHGPYDPTLPKGWGLINLENLRNNVLDMSRKDLKANGLDLNAGLAKRGDTTGKLELLISKKMVDQLTRDSDVLDPMLIDAMSRQ